MQNLLIRRDFISHGNIRNTANSILEYKFGKPSTRSARKTSYLAQTTLTNQCVSDIYIYYIYINVSDNSFENVWCLYIWVAVSSRDLDMYTASEYHIIIMDFSQHATVSQIL